MIKTRVALISMPWNKPEYPSIQIGLLKAILMQHGIYVDSFYLYLRLLKYVELDTYNEISKLREGLLSEWIFSKELFGNFSADQNDQNYIKYLKDIGTFTGIHSKLIETIWKIRDNVISEYLDECEQLILSGNYDVVGFSCTFNQVNASLCLAQRLKMKRPDIRIIFGGSSFDGEFSVEAHRAFPWLDVIFNGESDYSLPEYIKRIDKNLNIGDIPGMSYKFGGEFFYNAPKAFLDLDDNPTPDYAEYFDEVTFLNSNCNVKVPLKAILFESSRGCWSAEKRGPCKFCSFPKDRIRYRSRSKDNIISEIDNQQKKYKTSYFFSVERVSLPNIMGKDSYFKTLNDSNRNIKFYINVKASIRKKEIEYISRAGVKALLVGIESFNTHLLQLMGKGVNAMQNLNFIKWATYYDINVQYSLLFKLPGEQKEDYIDILNKIPLIYHFRPPSFYQQIFIYRGTHYFNNRKQYGIDIDVSDDWQLVYPKKIFPNGGNNTFSYKSDFGGDKLYRYYKRIERLWILWKELFFKHSECFLSHYINDKGQYIIVDTRNLNNKRRIVCTSEDTMVLMSCEEPATMLIIQKKISEQGGKMEVDHIQDILNKYTAEGILYYENNRWLDLSIPINNKNQINYVNSCL